MPNALSQRLLSQDQPASHSGPERSAAASTGRKRSAIAAGASKRHQAADTLSDFVQAYKSAPIDRVRMIKAGLDAQYFETVARRMDVSKECLMETLGLTPATVDRRRRDKMPFAPEDSARLLGIARLVGQVEDMVAQSGIRDGFDPAKWVGAWLDQPVPALGGMRPAELMDTTEGQGIVSKLVAQMHTGAYA